MKLLNHTLLYFSVALLIILGIWAAVFYVNMLDEVYDSLDDGLDNYRLMIIQKASGDSTVLYRTSFGEANYAVREIPAEDALRHTDIYKDTLMYMQNEEDYEPVRLLTTAFEGPGNRYYELQVISSMVEEDDLIEDLLYSLLWLYLALVASILVINNWLLRRIWKPFYVLLNQLKKFRLDKKQTVVMPETRIREFRDLNGAVDDLLQNAVATYNSQKQFIENASHELQTPLAISMNKLELLAEREDLQPEAAETVNQVMGMMSRLMRLNRSLLLLSKIENRQFPEAGNITLNAIVRRVMDDLSDYIAFRDVTFSFSENGNFVHGMPEDLAEILVSNLIRNAIVHNIPGGKAEVIVTPQSLTVKSTGASGPLDTEKIFTRFYKGHPAGHSTGLGLAIVKAITDLSGLQIGYSFDGMHNFIIRK